MGLTFRLVKGTKLTYQEGDDNLRFPFLWDIAGTFSVGMMVYDSTSALFYEVIQDVTTPNTISIANTAYYKPVGAGGGGGGLISNDPFDASWSGVTTIGASKNALYNVINNLGKFADNVVYVDAVVGNNSTGRRGNVNYPYQTIQGAVSALSGSVPGAVWLMPGTHNITGGFGIPFKNNLTFLGWQATISIQSAVYSPFLMYPSAFNLTFVGVTIDDHYATRADGNNKWGSIVPYSGGNLTLIKCTINSLRATFGATGGSGTAADVFCYDCTFVADDNYATLGGGNGYYNSFANTYGRFYNCRFVGQTIIAMASGTPGYNDDKIAEFYNCRFESLSSYTSGELGCIVLIDTDSFSSVIFDNCHFDSPNQCFTTYSVASTPTCKVILRRNTFVSATAAGWVLNNSNTLKYIMMDNWANETATGPEAVINQITATGGITVDAEVL